MYYDLGYRVRVLDLRFEIKIKNFELIKKLEFYSF